MRNYASESEDLVERRMKEVLEGVARAGGGSYELTCADRVAILGPATVAEDFSYFAITTRPPSWRMMTPSRWGVA